MRRVLTMLLLVLLPLQWSAAAAAVVCRHGAQGGHAHAVGGHPDAALSHQHDGHAGGGPAPAGHAHRDTAHAGHAPDGVLAFAGSDHAATAALDVDCGHPDCGACCQVAGAAPPSAAVPRVATPVRCAPVVRPDRAPSAPACDGVFRPPRLPVA